MTAQPKKQIIRDMTVSEISSVDVPAVKGATAVLMKSADAPLEKADVAIIKNAEEVAKGAKPSFQLVEYENALLRRAELLARVRGITPEQALSASLNNDSVLRDLAGAMEAARMNEYGEAVTKMYGGA